MPAPPAFGRAWMNRELAFGRVDRDALDLFFEMCVREHAEQTGEDLGWRRRRLARPASAGAAHRPASARGGPEEASDPDVPIAALEWWSRINSLTTERRSSVVRRASVDRKAPSPGGASSPTRVVGDVAVGPIATDASGEDTDSECELQLKELMYNLSARQLSDDPVTNRAALEKDVALAWHVVCAYASDAFHEPTDAYVCSTSVVAVACGFPNVRDPLDVWKRKYASKNEGPPKRDGNCVQSRGRGRGGWINHEISACVAYAAPRKVGTASGLLRGVVPADHARVDWSSRRRGGD